MNLENYDKRFRLTKSQRERITAGTLTREQAFQEFIATGGLERIRKTKQNVPASVWEDAELTIDNFLSKTGLRFRLTKEQASRVKDGSTTREQVFAEYIASRRAANQGA